MTNHKPNHKPRLVSFLIHSCEDDESLPIEVNVSDGKLDCYKEFTDKKFEEFNIPREDGHYLILACFSDGHMYPVVHEYECQEYSCQFQLELIHKMAEYMEGLAEESAAFDGCIDVDVDVRMLVESDFNQGECHLNIENVPRNKIVEIHLPKITDKKLRATFNFTGLGRLEIIPHKEDKTNSPYVSVFGIDCAHMDFTQSKKRIIESDPEKGHWYECYFPGRY